MRLAILILLLFAVTTRAQEPDLLSILTSSSWRSDKERTVQWLEEFRPTLASNERFTNLFGDFTVKYNTDGTADIRVYGFFIEEDYQVLAAVRRKLVLQIRNVIDGSDDIRVIEFDEDFRGYSVYNRLALIGPEFREFFRILE